LEEASVRIENKRLVWRWLPWLAGAAGLALLAASSLTRPASGADQEKQKDVASSYDQIAPVLLGKESFQAVLARDKADKPSVMERRKKLLEERYDLESHPDKKCTTPRGKLIQVGPAARLPKGMTWDKLAALSSDEIHDRGCSPRASCRCRTPSTRWAAWSSRRW
jgi:hypothetical protein